MTRPSRLIDREEALLMKSFFIAFVQSNRSGTGSNISSQFITLQNRIIVSRVESKKDEKTIKRNDSEQEEDCFTSAFYPWGVVSELCDVRFTEQRNSCRKLKHRKILDDFEKILESFCFYFAIKCLFFIHIF